jgi:small-conductance mechanosensitive channel
MLGGERVLWITVGYGPVTSAERAARITARLEDTVADQSIKDPTVTITEAANSSELRIGPKLIMVVSDRDAVSIGVSRALLAQTHAEALEAAIRAERMRYAPDVMVRSGVYGLLATLALALVLWVISRGTRVLHGAIARWSQRWLSSVRLQNLQVFSPERLSRVVQRAVTFTWLVLVFLAVDLYLTYVLGLFPWTRSVSFTLLDSLVTPLRALTRAIVAFLPDLIILLVIAGLVRVGCRLVAFFFAQIREGRLVFVNFPAEWADPTNKIVRVLLITLGVVVAFPYLPASDSPAFAGVSVFMGVLISLASSSSLSNMIAGLVLTYTRAFRLGDRVQVGQAYGDIVEQALLVTRIRTIKNEEVTIPNGLVLSSSVTNYSRAAQQGGIILHTSVTIGYDAPWRQVHDLLTEAAHATPGIRREPRPFVWQTALNDFYVTYEINAYTDLPAEMPQMYAELHANIQDAFYKAGVEIMSPHFAAVRDGNTVAIPEPLRAEGYRPGAFRVVPAVPVPEETGAGRRD